MSKRVQVVLDEEEREHFRRMAKSEGLSLSAWLREAAREKIAALERRRTIETADELKRFFGQCRQSEKGVEPEWEQHKAVIERSRRSGEAGS
jgi:predicted HicB family RNase H-like nuclease